MKIIPVSSVQSYKTGQLQNISEFEISEVLGFEPNVMDDPDKVHSSWGAEVDGVEIAIWDWKGSQNWGQFSTYGPDHIFKKLFPNNY